MMCIDVFRCFFSFLPHTQRTNRRLEVKHSYQVCGLTRSIRAKTKNVEFALGCTAQLTSSRLCVCLCACPVHQSMTVEDGKTRMSALDVHVVHWLEFVQRSMYIPESSAELAGLDCPVLLIITCFVLFVCLFVCLFCLFVCQPCFCVCMALV